MLNIVVSGHIGGDPEVVKTAKQDLTKFSIAVNHGKDEPPTWVNISSFGKTGELVMKYLTKGDYVTVSGRGRLREYQKKDGGRGFSLDVVSNDVSFGPKVDMKKAPEDSVKDDDDLPF